MIVKVKGSCKSNEMPTEYCYSVNGLANEKNTQMLIYPVSKQLLPTQTTDLYCIQDCI